MNRIRSCICLAALTLAAWPSIASAAAKEKPSARVLAVEGKLDPARAALHLMLRDGVPLATLLEQQNFSVSFQPGSSLQPSRPAEARVTINTDRLVRDMGDQLNNLERAFGPPPWAWEKIDEMYPVKEPEPKVADWREIKGLTKAYTWKSADSKERILGPIEIRKNADERGKPLKDAKGMSLGYADNRLTDKSPLWNTEGIVFLPAKLAPETKTGLSAEWKLAQNHDVDKHDVEEATYSVPFTVYNYTGGVFEGVWAIEGKPYYQTDFSGGHQIRGVELSTEFGGSAFGLAADGLPHLVLGSYQNMRNKVLQYQLRVVPKINYSKVHKEGRHSTRKLGESWLRIGGMISLDYRWSETNPLDFGFSYETADDIRRERGHGDLWKAQVTWWANTNTGLTFEYQIGDTPIADEKIDLFTIGFQFKY